MALWTNTDAEASHPNWVNLALHPAGTELVFIDTEEAAVASNKARGIKCPGWWLMREYQDSLSQTRYKSELLVAMGVTPLDAGDDDTVPAVQTGIEITVAPEGAITVAGAASFAVTASVTPAGALAYQWQRKAVGATRWSNTRWSNVTGGIASTLALVGQTEDNSGDQYRVQVSATGAVTHITAPVTLVFGD